MKMSLIGGGGVRTPYFVESLAKYAEALGVTRLTLMDNDEEKLTTYGALAQWMAEQTGARVNIELTTDPIEAVRDAAYVVTTLRVGQDQARVLDETIALKHGVLGQETTGAGGCMYALRTIPVMLQYMQWVHEYARPDAMVFNFTNPAGLVTQAMVDAGYDRIVGICDNATGMKIELSKALKLNATSFFARVYGLNHLSWCDRVTLHGEDILPRLLRLDSFVQNFHDFSYFDRDLIRALRAIPNGYLYYYYHRERALQNILKSTETRGQSILRINGEMHDQMRRLKGNMPAMLACFREGMHRREGSYMSLELGGQPAHLEPIDLDALGIPEIRQDTRNIQLYEGYAGVVFNCIQAMKTGEPVDIALSVPNHGAIAGMADGDVVEITCIVDGKGIHPVPVADPPADNLLLMQAVKRYEKLTVQAAREKSRELAMLALMANPLVGSWSVAKALAEDYFEAEKAWLEGWK